MKVFYRTRKTADGDIIPYNSNIYQGLDGALKLGLETQGYRIVDEIYADYKKGDIVLDGVEQVKFCLEKFEIVPSNFDYPSVLKPYLGRKVWIDKINSIAKDPKKFTAGYFIKPLKQKVFTGRTVSSLRDLIGCGNNREDYEVFVSEPLNIVYECRGFVYYDDLIDLRPYKGDYRYMKRMDTDVIARAMQDWKKWEERPNACSLDFGVVETGNPHQYKTVLIEGNLPYALGCYGCDSLKYIRLINAYIAQISGVTDELRIQI